MRYLTTFLLLLCLAQGAAAQSRSIHGRVLGKDNHPLPGAVVSLGEDIIIGITDSGGNFSATVPDTTAFLRITHENYHPATVPLARLVPGETVTVTLREGSADLGEVVVSTGYQTLPKERATGSFDRVGTALLNRRVSTGILDRIENLTPGVLFDHSANAPDALLIRGRSTLFANATPLIVVDNFPYDGDISNLNPNDVESVTILKDAAAASIWGARAGNGVIVITTKRGRGGEISVEWNSNVTVSGRPNLFSVNTITSSDYIDLEQSLFAKGYYAGEELFDSFGLGHPPFTPVIEALRGERDGRITAGEREELVASFRGIDAREDISRYLYRRGINTQNALNLSGKSGALSYYLGGGWDGNRSSLVGANYHRLTLRSGNTLSLGSKGSLSLTLNYSETANRGGNNPGYALSNGGGKGLYPYARLVDDKGNPAVLVRDYNRTFADTAGGGLLQSWYYNPIEDISKEDHRLVNRDLLLNLGFSYTLFRGLVLEARYAREGGWGEESAVYKEDSYFTRSMSNRYAVVNRNAGTVTTPIPAGGIRDLRNTSIVSHQGRISLSFHHTGAQHDLSVLTGGEIKDYRYDASSGRSYGYRPEESVVTAAVDYLSYFPQSDNAFVQYRIPAAASLAEKRDHFLSGYGNASYTWRNRYILSLSARHDAANLFGVGANRRGTPLGSAGVAWRVDKESFYGAHWLPSLKLRVTGGVNGNIARNATAFTTAVYSQAYSTDAVSAIITSPPNRELRWERVRMLNAGIDFRVANDILSGSVEGYRKKASGLLGQAPLDPTLGINPSYSNGPSFFWGNVGGMKGSGWDIQLESVVMKRGLGWTVNGTFSGVKTEVTNYDLPVGNGSSYLSASVISPVKGKPVYGIYSFRWGGLNPATGAPRGIVNGKESEDYAAIFSGTPLDSMVYNGPATPTVWGALRNTWSYKNISLSINLSFKGGYFLRKTALRYSDVYSSWSGSGDYAKRWQQPGDEKHTSVPAAPYPADGNADNFYQYSEALVIRGDHLRWEDLSLSYDINGRVNTRGTGGEQGHRGKKTAHLPFSHLRLYAYVSNLGILWRANHDGIDPYYNNTPAAGTSLALGINLRW